MLNFVDELGSSSNAFEAGQQFTKFAQAQGASVVHMFMQTVPGGFRATTLPSALLDHEHAQAGLEGSKVIAQVKAGVSRVFWGVDLDKDASNLPEVDREISRFRHDACRQRSSVTFPMPDGGGRYSGAGVGIGFEDRGDAFLKNMDEICGSLAVASFAAHSRIQLLLSREVKDSPLSKRQTEVLQLLATGYQLGAIADRLSISDSTVNLHLSQLKKKLGTRTKEQALAIALTHGWISI